MLPSQWSVRTRITVAATVVVAVVVTAVAVTVVVVQRRELLANLDDALELRSDAIEAKIDSVAGLAAEVASSNDEDRLVQLVAEDGTILAATPNLRGVGALHRGEGLDEALVRTVHDLPIEDDSFRLASRPVDTPVGPAVLHVAENVDDLEDSVRILITSLAVAGPVAVALLALVVWSLVGRTLRPVEAIRAEVADIGGSDLHRRVPVPSTGDEVARLAVTMNAMLDRLEGASERQRRFVADASHELRSPITRLRTEVEVELAGSGERRSRGDRVLRSVLEEAADMERLVENLLLIARMDEIGPSRRAPVDLDVVVVAEALRARSTGNVVELDGVSAAHVAGDADALARVVRNLLDNAIRHARSRVSLSLEEVDGRARLVVDDDGRGVPERERSRVFERFARPDTARSRDEGGVGLGLAIVREVVEAHEGTVWIEDAPGGGARFVVEIPALF